MSLTRILAVLLLAIGLSGCGGGESTTVNPVTTTGTLSNYSGPAPATADVQSFRLNVWDNLTGRAAVAPVMVAVDSLRLSFAWMMSILPTPRDSRR